MPERREQRRLQFFALAGKLRAFPFFEKLRPLDRNGDDAAKRIERAGLDRAARRRKDADRFRADPQRDEPNGPIVDRHFAMTSVSSGVRVELERGLGGRKRRGELLLVERDGLRTGLENLPVAPAGQRDSDEIEVESPGQRAGQDGDRLAALGHHQDVTAQVEQACQFVTASQRFLRARPRHRRQVAGDEADGQEREQGHPVVRICDRQRADWRQEEEIEATTATSDVTTATHSRAVAARHEDDHQERHRNRRRVRHVEPAYINEGDCGSAKKCQSKPYRVARHGQAS